MGDNGSTQTANYRGAVWKVMGHENKEDRAGSRYRGGKRWQAGNRQGLRREVMRALPWEVMKGTPEK